MEAFQYTKSVTIGCLLQADITSKFFRKRRNIIDAWSAWSAWRKPLRKHRTVRLKHPTTMGVIRKWAACMLPALLYGTANVSEPFYSKRKVVGIDRP